MGGGGVVGGGGGGGGVVVVVVLVVLGVLVGLVVNVSTAGACACLRRVIGKAGIHRRNQHPFPALCSDLPTTPSTTTASVGKARVARLFC